MSTGWPESMGKHRKVPVLFRAQGQPGLSFRKLRSLTRFVTGNRVALHANGGPI